MALWTDIIDPATLTGYARASLADYEARKGTLAQFLPNRTVPDIDVRFTAGQTGLVEAAPFRSYDAEIEMGSGPSGQRVTIELPALGGNEPVTEYNQLRAQSANVGEAQALVSIQAATARRVRAVGDAIERMRGVVLSTGRATISERRFKSDDDFERPGALSPTATTLWSVTNAARVDQLEAWCDLYRTTNGDEPGVVLMSTRAFRAFAADPSLQTQLINGGARRPSEADVQTILSGRGLPPIQRYDRKVKYQGSVVSALPDNKVFLLPPPVDPDDAEGTDLGGTWWGRTLSSNAPEWGIEDSEQPGIVTGVWRNDKPPMGVEVIADAIALPVLANAQLSLAGTVL